MKNENIIDTIADVNIGFKTSVLAKEKGFPNLTDTGWYNELGTFCGDIRINLDGKSFHEVYPNEPTYFGIPRNNKYKKEFKLEMFPAPYQTKLQTWLRLKHHIHIDLFFDDNCWYIKVGEFTIPDFVPDIFKVLDEKDNNEDSINAFTEALEIGLVEALNLIKIKK